MSSNARAPLAAAILVVSAIASSAGIAGSSVGDADAAVATIPAFHALFGTTPGDRPVHTKGTVIEGVFIPAPQAATLSAAPHLTGAPTRVLVRLSNFMGVSANPDASPMAAPHGMAIKFLLPGRDTDIVMHSYNGFPVADPPSFLAFLRALAAGNKGAAPGDGELDRFLATHDAAKAFLDAPKPAPVSWANESFYGVNAFGFENASGESRLGRYFAAPVAGDGRLTPQEAAAADPDYLSKELKSRLSHAPVEWHLFVQLAAKDDQLTDGSRPWPPGRALVELGTLRLEAVAPAGDALGRSLLFSPLNLVEGIQPSDDPMLAARSRAYGASYRERTH